MSLKCEVRTVKLKWLEFENLNTGLKVERISFYEDVTLLVGLSGVGKTQILEMIEYSLQLAINKNIRLRPYHTKICFEINEDEYIWEYRIETNNQKELVAEEEEEEYFALDKLVKNNEILFERNEDAIVVSGYEKIPMPKRDESLLVQYAEDEKFKRIIFEIRKLYPIEIDIDVRVGLDKNQFTAFKSKIKDIIQEDRNVNFSVFSHLPTVLKLDTVKKYYPQIYVKIFDAVKELFVEIQDIDVVQEPISEMYVIAIKVYDKILLQHEISNGMLKTIYYIVELYTMSENSLVLIDEFENGLGVNCIDLLSDMLTSEREDLQFVITSHHPKIINSITKEKWKIIDRNISVITNSDSAKYGIGNSQHDAYFNLLSRWEFEGKV